MLSMLLVCSCIESQGVTMGTLGRIAAFAEGHGRRTGLALLIACTFVGMASAGDLQVSRYQVTDPLGDIYNGADITFEIDVENNDAVPVTDGVLVIDVAETMIVSAINVPGICSADGFSVPQTLTCNLPTLTQDAANPDYSFSFIATAVTANALSSTATISSAATTDSNGANDALTITPTVSSGADLTVAAATSVASLPAGARYDYTFSATNNGPDAVSEVTVDIVLPPSSDFGYVSATGTNWTCLYTGGGSQSVSCDYTGAAISAGNTFPVITVTGDADASSGTLSAQGDASVTQIGLGDPDASNNASNTATVTITPGTDLAAGITIPASIITGDTISMNLRITNNGPTAIGAGATITHSLDPNFTINGALPGGCVFASPVITCTAGALNDGGVENFAISLNANTDSGGNVVISATVAPPVGIDDGVTGNDTATDTFRIDDPAADVFMQFKGKTPNPVSAGGTMTSTIRIENDGPSILTWTPANPITITDDLVADETYSGLITANWSCTTGASPEAGYTTRVTCVTTDSGSLAVDARKTVQITTTAGGVADGTLTNRACVDVSTLLLADSDASNNCRTRGVRATTETANLTLTSEVSLASGAGYSASVTQPAATNSHFIRLTISNAAGGDTARNVRIRTNTLANWLRTTVNYNGGSVLHSTGVSIFSSDAGMSCSRLATTNNDIWCEVTNLLAGETRTLILQVDRAILDGSRTTTFTATSPDTIESDTSDNADTVNVDAEPNADLIVDDKQINPDPLSSGGVGNYIISVKNIGANAGDGVILTDPIDATRFDVLGVTTTAPGGGCDYGTTTPGSVTCTMGSFNRGQTYQVTAQIRPRFPFNGATTPGDFPAAHTNTASVTTTTHETDATNNSRSLIHNVAAPSLDLQVTNAEPSGFVEPSPYPDTLLYEIRGRNSGATLGTSVALSVTSNPPAGYEMAYNAGLSTIPSGVACSQATNNDPVICTFPDLGNGEERTPVLAFDIVDAGGGDPSGPITFGTTAVIGSDQDAFDSPTGNNTAGQTTTVIPRTDLEVVSKTLVSATPINIAEPIVYDIIFRNNGGSSTTQVRLTDTLPAGFSITATPVTFTASGTATVTGNSCSGATTILCVVDGLIPSDGSTITMQIEAAADFPFTGDLSSPIVNNVSIDVGQTGVGAPLSVDEVPGNNTGSASSGVLRVSSIAGRVYADDDQSGAFNGVEGIGGVTLTLSGTDLYGNAIPAGTTATTNPDGTFSFTGLPPSNGSGYTITETQPGGYSDFNESAGTSGGAVDNTSYNNTASNNLISGIALNEGVDATGYEFAEYSNAEIGGSIYDDINNNGVLDGGDSGIGGVYSNATQISLTGTDYAGNAVNLTASVNGSGDYTFADVPPSNGSGYTVAQTEEPSGYLDGLEENGAGNVVAGSVNSTEAMVLGVVGPGAALTDRNFGHVQNSSLAGVVWVDSSADAIRQGSETGRLENAVVQLSGTDDLSNVISCTFTAGADGAYSFPVAACPEIRPGTYTLTLTIYPNHTTTGAVTPVSGATAGATTISNIVVASGSAFVDNDFGVQITPIDAVDNDYTSTPFNGADGGATPDILTNDTLNGAVVDPTDITTNLTGDGGLTGVTLNPDGTLSIPAGTPAGDYNVPYEICENINLNNCDNAIIIVRVVAPVIDAIDNDYTATPINGADGGTTPNVLTNDTLNGAVVDATDITAALTGDGGLTGVTLNPDGTLSIPAGTPAGDYNVPYEICEILNPTNCDTAIVLVRVGAPTIDAVNDDYTATPFISGTGGTSPVITLNDTLNGATVDRADIATSLTGDGGLTGVALNLDGTLDIPAGAPAGTYDVPYEICENLNSTNCDTAFVKVLIVAPVIDAVDNDYTSTPINGADGGTTPSVFDNDTLNTVSFVPVLVTVNLTGDGGLTGVSVNPDGTLTVPAGTPAGSYDVPYEICEVLNPANCDTAIARVVINPPVIDAVDNDYTSTPINGGDGGNTPSVFDNDTLNTVSFVPALVTVTLTGDGGLTGVSVNPDGTLTVPAGTPAGSYDVPYEICEILNPTNCDTAIATILINPPTIAAVDNDYSSTPINGLNGGSTPNILINDTLNGSVVDPADITVTLTGDGGLTGVVLNPDGTLTVPAGTPAGSYDVPYEICEVLNPTNCDTAIVTVAVNPPAIDAVDNDYTATPINGSNGGNTPNILTNDTLNGAVIDPTAITVTLTGDGGLTGVALNPDGTLTVPAGTPAGTYAVPYEICEVLNPTNCDTAIVTVLINPPAIDAVDDDYSPIPINGVDGGTTPVITINDLLNDTFVDPADIALTLTGDGGLMGVTLNPDGTLVVPADTPAGTYGVPYEICEILNPANCDTAVATIVVTVTTSVSGIVYLDLNGDGIHQPGEPLHAGYIVEVRVGGLVVGTAVTDANGYYSIDGLDPVPDADIVFISPDTGTVVGAIQGLTLVAGSNLIDQNLPLDPSGVVYDFATGDPVSGATVTLTDIGGALLPAACLIDASQQSQVTGADGGYRFDLIPGANPACPVGETEYRIDVILPGGSPPIFGFPAEGTPLDATTCLIDAIPGGRCQVFDQITAPQPGTPSIYFLAFLLAQGDSDVINNHIPIDIEASIEPLTATKRVNTSRASVGTPLVYTITVRNNQGTAVNDIEIVDMMPVGFKYVAGSGRLDGVPTEPAVTGNQLVWSGIDLAVDDEVTIIVGAVVGAGVRVGDYTNQAYGETGLGNIRLTNTAEATVRITPDEVFDCSEVIGKVFEDTNGNGIQDRGEDGLAGVRVVTVRGLLITTDEHGRYHIACAAAPRLIGSNFILKVDERTLPSGFSISTENPRVIRLTKGKMSEANFGVQKIRVVRMDLIDAAFVSGSMALKPEWAGKLDDAMELLEEQPSILHLSYVGGAGGAERLEALAEQIRERWGNGPYELKIEADALSETYKEER